MNTVIYARVSTEKQADKELSIPAQLAAMRAYARQHGYFIVREFIEPGASAKTSNRPQLQALLSFVKSASSEAKVVLVHKIDRLARNVYDHATIRAVLKQHGVRLASVVENVDDSIPGQLVENIMASIAQFYSSNLGEEVKKGMEQKVRSGGWPHLPPLGYTLRKVDGRSEVVIDATRSPFVLEAFELYATGQWGVRRLAEHLAERGLRTRAGNRPPHTAIRTMLQNPFYRGRLVWKGRQFEAVHKPIVPTELFERCQRMLKQRWLEPGPKDRLALFPLKVRARCVNCLGTMTAERHPRGAYYRCTRRLYSKQLCTAKLCNVERAHATFESILSELGMSPAMRSSVEEAARSLLTRELEQRTACEMANKERRTRLLSQRVRLAESYVAGQLTTDEFANQTVTIREQLAFDGSTKQAAPFDLEETVARVRRQLEIAETALALWRTTGHERRAALVAALFESLLLGPEGVISYTLREPFRSFLGVADATVESMAGGLQKAVMKESPAAPRSRSGDHGWNTEETIAA